MEDDTQELAATLRRLKTLGYTADFNLKDSVLKCSASGTCLKPGELRVDETYRFDEMDDPADQSVLYAISSLDGKLKGVFVDGFGSSSQSSSADFWLLVSKSQLN